MNGINQTILPFGSESKKPATTFQDIENFSTANLSKRKPIIDDFGREASEQSVPTYGETLFKRRKKTIQIMPSKKSLMERFAAKLDRLSSKGERFGAKVAKKLLR